MKGERHGCSILLLAGMLAATSPLFARQRVQERMSILSEVGRIAGVDEHLLHDGKCGFRWMAAVAQNARTLPAAESGRISYLLNPARAVAETVIGHFRLFYDTSSASPPALLNALGQRIPGTAKMYIDSVGKIFEDVWNAEIDLLGYEPPPMTDGTYSITIDELNGGDYGRTLFDLPPLDPNANPLRYRSSIIIDNDYAEYRTKGMDGLKVTAAHEFLHAIQVGAYGYWDNEDYAYELTATWMEDQVYPAVNDYLQYVPDFFGTSGGVIGMSAGVGLMSTSPSFGGYERCIWGQFLSKRYSPALMTRVWERMRNVRFVQATASALTAEGTTLSGALADFGYWNYFTADRADPVRFYEDGALFPRYRPAQTTPFNGSLAREGVNAEPASTVMFNFVVTAETLTVIVVNQDVQRILARDATTQRIDAVLSQSNIATAWQALPNGLSIGIDAADASVWRTYYLTSSTCSDIPRQQKYAFPNPWNLRTEESLILPVDAPAGSSAEVIVSTVSLDRLLYGFYPVATAQGATGIRLPASHMRGRASSGVYTISAAVEGRDYQWSIVIVP